MRKSLGLVLLLAASGCSCNSQSVSGIYGEGAFAPSEGVQFAEGVATLDFGSVAFGDHRTGVVLLDSVGRGPLRLAATHGPDAPFSVENLEGRELRPGERLAIAFQFAPPRSDEEFSATHAYESELTVSLANTESPTTMTIRLRGQGVLSDDCLQLSPSPLDFGTVRLGCLANRDVRVSNACAEPVLLNGVEVSGSGFSVAPGDIPQVLAPGGAHLFSARFEPADAGTHQGLLRVQFGSGETATARQLPLEAAAVPPSPVTESFVTTRAVDVLVVAPWIGGPEQELDDAGHPFYVYETDDAGYPVCSASNYGTEQDEAQRGLVALLSGFVDSGTDFHLGVLRAYWDYFGPGSNTNGEVPPDWVRGELTPPPNSSGPLIFTRSTPNLLPQAANALFNAEVSSHVAASWGMMGCFESVRRAITEPIASGTNTGFGRGDVPLVIICLDEPDRNWGEDYSTTQRPPPLYSPPLPIQFYVDAFEDARGGPHRVSISSVSFFAQSDSADCDLTPSIDTSHARNPDQPQYRARLVEAANATGGLAIDWCEPWGKVLLDQQPWASLQRKFRLAGTPDPREPMEVRVAGTLLPPTQWSFDAATRIVQLAELPAQGVTVEVTYTPGCPVPAP